MSRNRSDDLSEPASLWTGGKLSFPEVGPVSASAIADICCVQEISMYIWFCIGFFGKWCQRDYGWTVFGISRNINTLLSEKKPDTDYEPMKNQITNQLFRWGSFQRRRSSRNWKPCRGNAGDGNRFLKDFSRQLFLRALSLKKRTAYDIISFKYAVQSFIG